MEKGLGEYFRFLFCCVVSTGSVQLLGIETAIAIMLSIQLKLLTD